jgi:hypothetical protein
MYLFSVQVNILGHRDREGLDVNQQAGFSNFRRIIYPVEKKYKPLLVSSI